MERPRIVLLVGGQNSGKSTWAEEAPNPKKVISRDAVRETYASEHQIPYQETFAPDHNVQVGDRFFDTLKLALADRTDLIIVDNTNMKAKDRKAILDIVNEYGHDYHRSAALFPLTAEEALQRNAKRDAQWQAIGKPERRIPEAIIRATYESYEPPLATEGFNTISNAAHLDVQPPRDTTAINQSTFDASGLLNPDMDAQTLRLHMGEMTAQEVRTARADSLGKFVCKGSVPSGGVTQPIRTKAGRDQYCGRYRQGCGCRYYGRAG